MHDDDDKLLACSPPALSLPFTLTTNQSRLAQETYHSEEKPAKSWFHSFWDFFACYDNIIEAWNWG
jgi:hypothetical protein